MDGHALHRMEARSAVLLARRLPRLLYNRHPVPTALALVPLSLLAALGLWRGAPVVAGKANEETIATLERQAFDSLALARAREGLPPVQYRADVLRVARSHSRDMVQRGYFSHYAPADRGPGARLEAAGIPWTRYGEDIARTRGARPAPAVIASWLAGPENQANLLDPDLAAGAVGVARAEDGLFYVTLLLLEP